MKDDVKEQEKAVRANDGGVVVPIQLLVAEGQVDDNNREEVTTRSRIASSPVPLPRRNPAR